MAYKFAPATLQEIETLINEAYSFAANAKDEDYGRGRGAHDVLDPGQNYAELPGIGGKTPREVIATLPAKSAILDVGCGYGQLGAEILQDINPNIDVYGCDAQKQNGQERLNGVVIGNVDDLRPATFGKEFDLILSSALLYHLPDYWGAILRMAHMLKQDGMLLASTMPRIVEGESEPHYYRNRNVFDIDGGLLAPEVVVAVLNEANTNFELQYSLARAPVSAIKNVGGQIAGKRLGESAVNFSSMFYCLYNGSLGYVLAKNSQEVIQLDASGYVNVQARYQKEETLRKPFL